MLLQTLHARVHEVLCIRNGVSPISGVSTRTQLLRCRYSDLMDCMDSISLEELIMAVRRQSQGFSRGTSAFRGVTHHPSGTRST